ncbi:MAG: glutaminase domain-containing protein [Lachnospirales bacterium]
MTRVPSVPLIVNDPYFSIWSPADMLNEKDTEHWAGSPKRLIGYVKIDGEKYLFLGRDESAKKIQQIDLEINPNSTVYTFSTNEVELKISFISHIILSDLQSVSEPFTYLKADVKFLDGKKHEVKVSVYISANVCYEGHEVKKTNSYSCVHRGMKLASMGRSAQQPLNTSADHIAIDWGYAYIATKDVENACVKGDFSLGNDNTNGIKVKFKFNEEGSNFAVFAYDDILSIMYFDEAKKAYWAKDGKNIIDVIKNAVDNFEEYERQSVEFDEKLKDRALKLGGEEYVLLCSLGYKQSICAHKLIEHNGEPIFLSKECDSNGCIGTVDVSYPSIPLYLEYAPKLVKGMMTPIFEFAEMDIWNFDFAPHDVGRYPYATGQVYGLKDSFKFADRNFGNTNPQIYMLPKELDIFDLRHQMPVEECGNMIAMAAMYYTYTKDIEFVKKYIDTLGKWADYLVRYGEDPGEQLCTDDFAGHLNHNINLSAKAVLGIKFYSMMLKECGSEKSDEYELLSKDMAKSLVERAKEGEYTKLTYDKPNTWSLKYNTIWDNILGLGLFSEEFYNNEIKKYLQETNEYGVPLDSRCDYTKTDWILWAASFSNTKDELNKFIKPIYKFLEETPNRVPFSDWIDTKTGGFMHFKNRTVQGGLFMPFVKETFRE